MKTLRPLFLIAMTAIWLGSCADGALDKATSENSGSHGDGPGQLHDNPNPSPDPGLTPCGNARLDPGEECDDGNRRNGDGCNLRCQLERSDNIVLDVKPAMALVEDELPSNAKPVNFAECRGDLSPYAPGERLNVNVCAIVFSGAGHSLPEGAVRRDLQEAQEFFNLGAVQIGLNLIHIDTVGGNANQTDPTTLSQIEILLKDLRTMAESMHPSACQVVVGYTNTLRTEEHQLGGIATFPIQGIHTTLVASSTLAGWITAHELGHVFGLFHTHETTGNDGGDECNDTSPDPLCSPAVGCNVVCENGTRPPSENVMSYYGCGVVSSRALTSCQGLRMRCFTAKMFGEEGGGTGGRGCGDSLCEPGEESTCCQDCGCPSGETCQGGTTCVPNTPTGPSCDDGFCDPGEENTCCQDCGCQTNQTCEPSGQCATSGGSSCDTVCSYVDACRAGADCQNQCAQAPPEVNACILQHGNNNCRNVSLCSEYCPWLCADLSWCGFADAGTCVDTCVLNDGPLNECLSQRRGSSLFPDCNAMATCF